MAKNKNHKNPFDNGNKALQQVQQIIASVIGQVAKDYQTLFAVADETATAEPLCERHKQGKIILSHLEALLKINEIYIEKSSAPVDDEYKNRLIDTARSELQEKPKNYEKN